jgi:competence protein ComEC
MERLAALWSKIPLFWRLMGPGLLVALTVVALLQGRADGWLHLYFLPVGQGNGILAITPTGRTVLIDGGPDATALLTALGRYRPFWSRELDWAILTETAPERLAGPVAVLERYRVEAAGRPGRVREGAGWERWAALLAGMGVEPLSLAQGARLELGDGVVLEVLHPGAAPLDEVKPGARDDALVLRLCYGGVCVLLPTAAGPAGQQALLGSGQPLGAAVLLVPRQGEERSLDATFLKEVHPAIAIVSMGTGRYEGADARVLEMLRAAGAAVYRTDRQSTVEVVTDGERVWVQTEHRGGE